MNAVSRLIVFDSGSAIDMQSNEDEVSLFDSVDFDTHGDVLVDVAINVNIFDSGSDVCIKLYVIPVFSINIVDAVFPGNV